MNAHKYIVGKSWPHACLGYDNLRPVLDDASIALVAEVADPNPSEISAFSRGSLRYGLHISNSIPIILLDIPDLATFDSYLNLHLESQDKRDAFLDSEPMANMMQCYLVDGASGILRGIRVLGTEHQFLRDIKEACFNQLSTYPDAASVARAAKSLIDRHSTDDLINAARMYAA